MNTKKNKIKESDKDKIWNKEKLSKLKDYILSASKKQSPERKLKNEMLAIKYQMQDYIEKDRIEQEMRILDFVRLYQRLLNLNQKKFASIFEMKDSNLYKYLIGERKLSPDLVLKLSSFSNTKPELWYYIEIKNELFELNREKGNLKKYEKYNYRNYLSPAMAQA